MNSCLAPILAVAVSFLAGVTALDDACVSQVYCEGQLLQTVQLAKLYDDSKTFVDKRQKQSEAETLVMFDNLMQSTGNNPTSDQVRAFVDSAFEDGSQLVPWTPPDFTANPALLATIADPNLRAWASDLNNLWINLGRKMTTDVQLNPDRYSIIYVPEGFVVPGGRFQEFYYWDTYWIMRGILECELYDTARGILKNFLSMVDQYGFVPNGGRVYYLNRSQPPMLTPMVKSYVDATGDLEYFRSISATLEKEYQFWMDHKTVQVEKEGVTYTLARYFVPSGSPRPESYSEDYNLAQTLPEADRLRFYQNMRSGAESGWDFSTRWFMDSAGTNNGNLSTVNTQSIIPVDLNAFIYWNAALLSDLFSEIGQPTKALAYRREADKWLAAVTAVLWHEDLGIWLDYDIDNNKRRDYFYPSNLAPLWTNCYDKAASVSIASKVVSYLENSGSLTFLGGLPTSLVNGGEQWDLPNAWPPLQHIAIMGLDQTGHPPAQDLAFRLAQQWVHANYLGYQESQEMYEKYDAITPGAYGGGGEYTVQAGFGWTNGVVLDLLAKYGNRLQTNKKSIHMHNIRIKQV